MSYIEQIQEAASHKKQLYGHLLPISKPFKLDEQDTWVIAGEARRNS